MKRGALILLVAMVCAAPASAQGLRDKINELFIFGSGEDPLFLGGTADPDNPASIQVHGDHFVPAAVESNGTIISFLTAAIGTNIANIPISATSSGQTFKFMSGVPVPTATSPGPIFAERAQTLGRGRVLVGATLNVINLKTVRGVDLDNLLLNFTHENVDFEGCDAAVGGDCSLMGVPTLENEYIQLDLSMDLRVRAAFFVLTYGLFDWMDIGVAVPIVSTSLQGFSEAQVVPFSGPEATHFFSGTPTNPELGDSRFVEGSASGLGDIAARLKVGFSQSEQVGFGILADARFATGSAEDLLGSGSTSIRGLGIVSARFSGFSPHANVGYVYRSGELQNDAVLATIGFDQVLASWATLAADLITELQAGDTKLNVPGTVTIESPFTRTVEPTNIPNMRDDIVNGSIGFKFTTAPGLIIVTNALVPLNNGALRPDVAWTLGLEYNF
jgi:hypothetical protein